MKLDEIKTSVDSGAKVHWKHVGYEVIKDKFGKYLIKCNLNESYIGLTWTDNLTLNGDENDFYLEK